MYGQDFLSNDLFTLDLNSSYFYMVGDNIIDYLNWHTKLSYISKEIMTKLIREGLLGSFVNVRHLCASPIHEAELLENHSERHLLTF